MKGPARTVVEVTWQRSLDRPKYAALLGALFRQPTGLVGGALTNDDGRRVLRPSDAKWPSPWPGPAASRSSNRLGRL